MAARPSGGWVMLMGEPAEAYLRVDPERTAELRARSREESGDGTTLVLRDADGRETSARALMPDARGQSSRLGQQVWAGGPDVRVRNDVNLVSSGSETHLVFPASTTIYHAVFADGTWGDLEPLTTVRDGDRVQREAAHSMHVTADDDGRLWAILTEALERNEAGDYEWRTVVLRYDQP